MSRNLLTKSQPLCPPHPLPQVHIIQPRERLLMRRRDGIVADLLRNLILDNLFGSLILLDHEPQQRLLPSGLATPAEPHPSGLFVPLSALLLLRLELGTGADQAPGAKPPLDPNSRKLMRWAVAADTGLGVEVAGELLGLNQAVLDEVVNEASDGIALSVEALIE